MARDRLELQEELEDILGGEDAPDRVYYQPNEQSKLEYPCIVYAKSPFFSAPADNIVYRTKSRYDVILIDRSPDHPGFDAMVNRPYCSHSRSYVADGLNHDVFDLYH